MIDSHCHVADPVFAPDLEAVLARGREAGLTHVLCILAAGDAAEQAQAERVAAQFTGARFAVGVHPHQAHEAAPAGRADDLVRAACATTCRCAPSARSGSTITTTSRHATCSEAVFAEQVALARELDLPGDHPYPRSRGRYIRHPAERRTRRSQGGVPLLHRRRRGWRAARSISASCCRSPASSPFRRPRASARRRRSCRTTACWPKPTARFSRPYRIAGSGTNRPWCVASSRRWRSSGRPPSRRSMPGSLRISSRLMRDA